jgi:SpoIID/LytB domain protein
MNAQPPTVAVGLMLAEHDVAVTLTGQFAVNDLLLLTPGRYAVRVTPDGVELLRENAWPLTEQSALRFQPLNEAHFTIHDVTIGIDFHWQRQEDQQFDGALRIERDPNGMLLVINDINVEDYLTSVIASEMSATAHPELLKAHAIISRSWLLAQLPQWRVERITQRPPGWQNNELVNWYDRDNHAGFDICADDHCQRFQGRAKATAANVYAAIAETCGTVLMHGDELCDARFSKSCGGFTELFASAWQAADVAYLQALYDGETFPHGYALPLCDETNAERWIRNAPAAFCATKDRTILQRILPSFDQETEDFYRWQTTIQQDELQTLLKQKLGLELGAIRALEPVERGASGRLTKLRITGEHATVCIGKELEIRRALSASHLYSSAFIVTANDVRNGIPASFTLRGAGWGHGVGLCQIGAALMAERGYSYQEILQHYYRGATLHQRYSG